MNDFFFMMWKPLLACLVLVGIHAYFGFHVIKREVIFVDLSLAQIAALGAVVALLFGFEPQSWTAYWMSLTATLFGALFLSLTRIKDQSIPQEAMIGIIYVVSSALAILLLQHSPEGDEHIRQMLVGNVLLVEGHEILRMALIYFAVGVFHFIFQKKFLRVSNPKCEKVSWKWDLFFYLTFGIVVTSSVKIAGVLLVFSFLIMPASMSILLVKKVKQRLLLGWALGAVLSFIGIAFSYKFDLPTGATIVCTHGFAMLVIYLMIRSKKI
jgi:zinc/manganese transport system permease protein